MPGSGKSTIGRHLADALGYRFVDLDDEVVRLTGRPVAELFLDGEATFRTAERNALHEITGASRVVVATGGGALIDSASLDTAMRSGVVVYLRAPVATLARRLEGGADRPLLVDDEGGPLAPGPLEHRLDELLKAREAVYHRADVVVDASQESPESVAAEIASRLGA
jgi:shikimate kinase